MLSAPPQVVECSVFLAILPDSDMPFCPADKSDPWGHHVRKVLIPQVQLLAQYHISLSSSILSLSIYDASAIEFIPFYDIQSTDVLADKIQTK